MSKIKHIFSVVHYTMYGAVCFQFNFLLCDDWESIHFVLLSSSNRKYCLGLCREKMVWAVCFSIFFKELKKSPPILHLLGPTTGSNFHGQTQAKYVTIFIYRFTNLYIHPKYIIAVHRFRLLFTLIFEYNARC